MEELGGSYPLNLVAFKDLSEQCQGVGMRTNMAESVSTGWALKADEMSSASRQRTGARALLKRKNRGKGA